MARAATEEVREHLDLFGWARQEAQRIEEARAEQARRVKAKREAEEALQATVEWKAMDEARRALADAKKAALEEDLAVGDAKAALKAARKKVRGLEPSLELQSAKEDAAVGEAALRAAESGLAYALACGEVPSKRAPEAGEVTASLTLPDGTTTGPVTMGDIKRATQSLRAGRSS
jgi:hypothetical protein